MKVPSANLCLTQYQLTHAISALKRQRESKLICLLCHVIQWEKALTGDPLGPGGPRGPIGP